MIKTRRLKNVVIFLSIATLVIWNNRVNITNFVNIIKVTIIF